MRPNRSPDEHSAIEAVRFALHAEGHVTADDGSFTDRPDWVFRLDDARVGAECTCINLEQLMAWQGRKAARIVGKHYEVRFANEPHLWVKKALEAKNSKVKEYVRRANCSAVWLILHSEFSPFPLFACSPEMLALMRAAAASVHSDFEAVWFVHAELGATRPAGVGCRNARASNVQRLEPEATRAAPMPAMSEL